MTQVQAETREIEAAIKKLNEEVRLLGEYRTRLVADVVMGKLDVREAAACLVDDPAPPTDDDTTEIDPESGDENTQE